jgi:hypothetical protein
MRIQRVRYSGLDDHFIHDDRGDRFRTYEDVVRLEIWLREVVDQQKFSGLTVQFLVEQH